MRFLLVITLFLFLFPRSYGQGVLYNGGGFITVESGTVLFVDGDIRNNDGSNTFKGEVCNRGEIIVTGDVGNVSVDSLFFDRDGLLIFSGTENQTLSSNIALQLNTLEVANADTLIFDADGSELADSLVFTSGHIHLNDNELWLYSDFDQYWPGFSNENESSHLFDHYLGIGKVRGTALINNSTLDEPPFNFGLHIETSGVLGLTEVIRAHGKQGGPNPEDGGPANGSILRFYDMYPMFEDQAETIQFDYFDDEIDALDETYLGVWQSPKTLTLGVSWLNRGGVLNTINNVAEANTIPIDTNRLTLAEVSCDQGPVSNLADTIYFCADTSITISVGNPGMTYLWSSGDTTEGIRVDTTGLFFVSILDANGCVTRDTAVIFEVAEPIAAFSQIAGCFGDTVSFTNESTDTSSISFLWDFGVGISDVDTSTLENPRFYYSEAGAWTTTLVVTNSFGCSDSVVEAFPVHPLPEAQFSANDTCQGLVTRFQNTSTIAEGSGLFYSWNFGDSQSSDLQSPEHVYDTLGTYEVTLIVTSNADCRDTLVRDVEVFLQPVVDFVATDVCVDSLLEFENLSNVSTSQVDFSWTFGDGVSSDAFSPTKSYSQAGTYEVRLIASTTENCHDTLTRTVVVQPCNELVDCTLPENQPAVNLGDDRIVCEGQLEMLDAGVDAAAYEWTTGEMTQSIDVSTSGTFGVTVSNEAGCLDYDEAEVSLISVPKFTLTDDIHLCQPENGAELNAILGKSAEATITWSQEGDIVGVGEQIVVFETGQYVVSATDIEGCGFVSYDTVSVLETGQFLEAIFLSKSSIIVGDTILFVQLSNPSPSQVLWDFDDGITSEEFNPVHAFFTPGIFDVSLTASNGVCHDTLIKEITVSTGKIPDKDTIADTTIVYELVELPEEFWLYPNPTDGLFTFEMELDGESSVELQLYDLGGQVIIEKTIVGRVFKESFDIQNQPSGLYVLKIVLAGQFVSNKLIKY